MSRVGRSWAGVFVAAAVVGSLTAAAIPSQAAARPASGGHPSKGTLAAPVVVASGLNNPRAVRLQPDGSLLVAESGTGSATPCVAPSPGVITRCLGMSGSIYRVKGSTQGRVVTGLPSESIVRPDGSVVVTGANEAQPGPDGSYRLVYGFSGVPSDRAALGAGAGPLGTLSTDKGVVLGDLLEHELLHDPDSVDGNNSVFSDPWNFAADGPDFLVTDAGANDLVRVHPDGTTTTAFVFPNNVLPTTSSTVRPMAPPGQTEAVPTGIVRGADGAFYIADMSGMRVGLSRIWRYVPGSQPTIFATGLTDVIDLALAPNGDLIALSYGSVNPGVLPPNDYGPGMLTRIDKRTGASTTLDTGNTLVDPTGLAICPNGDIYVTSDTQGSSGELLNFPAG